MNNLGVIQELYRTFREKDYDCFRSLCTDDIEWIQNKGFPGGATRRGPQAVIDGVFKSFAGEWDSFAFEIDEYLVAGDAITVVGRYVGKHRASGKSFEAGAVHIYDLLVGKVARFRQYTDTKVIWDAMA